MVKLPPPIGRARFENTKGNNLFNFFDYLSKHSPPKNYNSNYIGLINKYAFQITFGPLEVLKLKMSSWHRLDIFSLIPSRSVKLIWKADFLRSVI